MKKIWAKRGKVTTNRTKKSKIPPLTISEDHRARIPANPSWSPSPEVDKIAKTEMSDTNDEDMPEESERCDFEGGEDVNCVQSVEREDLEEAGKDAPKHNDAFVDNFGDFGMESVLIMQEPSGRVSD